MSNRKSIQLSRLWKNDKPNGPFARANVSVTKLINLLYEASREFGDDLTINIWPPYNNRPLSDEDFVLRIQPRFVPTGNENQGDASSPPDDASANSDIPF